MSKISGGRSRGFKSTINWTIRAAATVRIAIVPGALYQPEECRNMLLHPKYLPKLTQISFRANPNPEQYREANPGKSIFILLRLYISYHNSLTSELPPLTKHSSVPLWTSQLSNKEHKKTMFAVNVMQLFFIQPKQAVSFKENTKFIHLFKVLSSSS